MAYFNGKKVFFSPNIVIEGIDKGTLETALNESVETVSAYPAVELTDITYVHSWLPEAVIVTEDMVKNGLYMLRIAEGTPDKIPYLISGADVYTMYNEQTMQLPRIGEVGVNLINDHNLSAGMIIAKEQKLEDDGCIFVTALNIECVTKENIDKILSSM